MNTILVTGAGGFIGNHLVTFLKDRGYYVRGVDLKYPEFSTTQADEFYILDLREEESCEISTQDIDHVYHLAADMGGMGFISRYQAQILRNNLLIDTHMLESARVNKCKRFYYTSSACIYPEYLQTNIHAAPLKETDAYPAQPQDTYGWEKLIMEILCQEYKKEYGIETRISRFHNIFGPLGTYKGGREKAPAALCRKIAEAKLLGRDYIDIWGDGKQERSFCHVGDCVRAIYELMFSLYDKPVNIGQDRMITINDLADMIMTIAGISLQKRYSEGPQGVRSRNSDNTLLYQLLSWRPEITLEEGLYDTYTWIEKQVEKDISDGHYT